MRCFEILILTGLLITLVILHFVKKGGRALIYSSIITAIAMVGHFVFEGDRWSMVPAYLYATILIPVSLIIFFRGRNKPVSLPLARRVLRIAGISLTYLLLVIISIPPLLLPVFKIPEPGGPLAVGTTTMYFSDSSRIDSHADKLNKYREVSVRIWYPAMKEGQDHPMPYMKTVEAQALSELYNMPRFFLSHFNLVKTQSYQNAPPLEGNYPLVLYSPSGDMLQNTTLFQELASHGYIVLSVGHSYWNAFYYDSEGQVIPFDGGNEYYLSLWEEESSDSVNAVKEEITTAPNLEKKRIAQKKLNVHMPLEIADIRLWSGDLSFVLDELENPAQNMEWLSPYMDVNRTGVIGFSKGGSSAGQFCVSDQRCRAGINLSGFMFGDAVDKNIDVPFMFMENVEEWCQDCAPICEVFYKYADNDAYMVRIKGARHGNFSDWSLVGGLLKISGMNGPINGRHFLEIQSQYVRSFFDRYLKGTDAPLLNSEATSFPEVEFNSRIAAGSI